MTQPSEKTPILPAAGTVIPAAGVYSVAHAAGRVVLCFFISLLLRMLPSVYCCYYRIWNKLF